MILSPSMKAFDLSQEPDAMREAYGKTQFGNGCLLARRLIESGVTFIEIDLGGWDTHADNFAKTKELAGQVDQPFAQLIADLKQRGLFDSTVIMWMGEFGRTPIINPRGGRDHFPQAFNAVLAGGGIRGGQVIGETDKSGSRNHLEPRHRARPLPNRLQEPQDRGGERKHEPDRPADQSRRWRQAGEGIGGIDRRDRRF